MDVIVIDGDDSNDDKSNAEYVDGAFKDDVNENVDEIHVNKNDDDNDDDDVDERENTSLRNYRNNSEEPRVTMWPSKRHHVEMPGQAESSFDSVSVDSAYCSEEGRVTSLSTIAIGSARFVEWDKAMRDIIFTKDRDGDNGLMRAIIKLDFVRTLQTIDSLPSHTYLRSSNRMFQTALHLAVIVESVYVTRRLLVAGAPVDVRDRRGDTPLHCACRRKLFEIAECLLRPVTYLEVECNKYKTPYQKIPQETEMYNAEGLTCFHLAARNADVKIMNMLLAVNAHVNAKELKTGQTSLHVAAENGNLTLVKFLLNTPEVDVNCQAYNGATAVYLASMRRDNSDVVFQLLFAGAKTSLVTYENADVHVSCDSESDSSESDSNSSDSYVEEVDVNKWLNLNV